MNPKKKLTFGQSVSVVLGLCFTVGILTNIFKKPPVQQAAAPSPVAQAPAPSPVAPATPAPKIIKGRFIRTGEDFRYDVPANITLDDDGTIHVTASREYQFGNSTNKSRFKFTFTPDGRWTEQEKTTDGFDGKVYPFTYDGHYSRTQVDGVTKISANFDELPKVGLPPWIAVEFTAPSPQSNTASPTILVADRSEPLPDIAPECKAQIDAVSQQIRQIKGLKLKQSRTETFSGGELEGYYPNGRNRTAGFIVENQGPAPASFMKSPILLTQLGIQIINACADLSTVSFSVDRSGWIETIGIFDDGAIRRFGCIEDIHDRPNTRERLPYGYINCAL
jgi:hypothetical protein